MCGWRSSSAKQIERVLQLNDQLQGLDMAWGLVFTDITEDFLLLLTANDFSQSICKWQEADADQLFSKWIWLVLKQS